jgi:hypothetical protein
MEARKGTFFNANDNTPARGRGQGAYLPQFIPDNQPPNFPRVVVAARRDYAYSRDSYIYSGESPLYTASSINRTATSGLAYNKMPPKRTSSASPSVNTGTPAKVPKIEQKPEDFSNSVKKRLQSSTRTGQACDRCKVSSISRLLLFGLVCTIYAKNHI